MLFDLKTLIHSTEQNYSQIKGLAAAYELLLGGIPNIEGFTALIRTNNETNFGSKTAISAGPVFNDETIIINSMSALYQGNPGAKAAFDAIAVGPTLAVKIAAVYDTLIPITHQTINGRIYFADQATFYSAKAAELGIPGEVGAALVAAAALTKIAIDNDIPGFGDGINDLIDSINDGSSTLPDSGSVLTQIEIADGANFDLDETAANANLVNITAAGNDRSLFPVISHGGDKVVYYSYASNLTASDTNGVADVFIYDVATASTINITARGNGDSVSPSVSVNGGKVAFSSKANNLTVNDANGIDDVFIYDAVRKTFSNLTEGGNGASFDANISAEGSLTVFHSLSDNLTANDTNGERDIFLHDSRNDSLINITAGFGGGGTSAVISTSGNYVAFSGFSTSGDRGSYLYNVASGIITKIPAEIGEQPEISTNGSKILGINYDFSAPQPNVNTGVFVYDKASGSTIELPPIPGYSQNAFEGKFIVKPGISADGSKAALALLIGDESDNDRIVVYDFAKNEYDTIYDDGFVISYDHNLSLSGNGNTIAFSAGHNEKTIIAGGINIATDIFIYDATNANHAPTVRISPLVNSIEDTENNSTGRAMATIIVTDDGVGVNNLSLGGADADLFVISGTELRLKPGVVLDPVRNTSLDVTVSVTDLALGVSFNDSTTFSIPVIKTNKTPTVAIASGSAVISENVDTSTRVKAGDIVVTDDGIGVNDLFLSGDDANLFEIVGTELFLKAGSSLDFETNPTLDVTVNVNDGAVGPFPDDTATLSIAVIDVDDEPTIDFGFSKFINATAAGNGASRTASVDANGAKVAFASDATNLAGVDSNGVTDVIVYNVATAAFTNVTAAANLASSNPSISSNGSKVAFTSTASNLTPGDADGGLEDIFIYDLASATFTNVSGGSSLFSDNASWSADGGTLVFNGFVGSVDQIFTYDVAGAALTNLTATGNGASFGASASTNGNIIAFSSSATNLTANDVNGQVDVIVYNKSGATFSNITAAGNGGSGEASISADGSKVVFTSGANNLTANDTNAANDIFLYNASTASITNITAFGNMDSSNASISADGSKITFSSFANNLTKNDINGELDVFLYDVATATISNLSALSNRPSTDSTISSNGGHAAFSSNATNLTVNDINGQQDIFFYEFA